MPLLDLPDEIILQIFEKLNLVDRINLSRTHTRLSPLCFDRSLQRKLTETLTLNELCQLYEQSMTENEKDQCFKSNVLDRLLIKNFNEVVHLYMDPKNENFVANGKIMHYLKGNFVLERETFSGTFVEQFLCMVEKAEGTILLAFVDVSNFDVCERKSEQHAKRCAQILSSKLERGQKVYFIEFCKKMRFGKSCAMQILDFMHSPFKFTITHRSFKLFDAVRDHRVSIDERNSVENTKELIDMINGDSLTEVKQHLEKVLALVEAAALSVGERDITCPNCRGASKVVQQSNASQHCNDVNDDQMMNDGVRKMRIGLKVNRITISMDEPRWSNCAGCALK